MSERAAEVISAATLTDADGRQPEPQTTRAFTAKNELPDVVLGFSAALRFSKHRVIVAPNVRKWIAIRSVRRLPTSALIDLRDLLGHLWLVPFAARHRGADLILVRGFRTELLAPLAWALWPLRKKLLFIIHHNLQWAHRRRYERVLKLLFRMSFQFGLLEADDGLAELGIKPRARNIVVLPLPVETPESSQRTFRQPNERAAIGVIGRDLREKNTDELMKLLLGWQDRGLLQADIIFASDNLALLRKWQGDHVVTMNTKDYDQYLAALARADVIVLNYVRDFYYYRSSGVINDAAGVGTAVVCPNFPVFRRQVTEPARIGALFDTPTDILPAIHLALAIKRHEPDNFKLWAEPRRPQEFSRRIDAFIDQAR